MFGGMPSPEMMQQMMQSPMFNQMMEQVLSNPEMMEQMTMADPRLRSLMDSNPELRAAMRDPQLMRQRFGSALVSCTTAQTNTDADKTRQDKTRQGKTRQGKAGPKHTRSFSLSHPCMCSMEMMRNPRLREEMLRQQDRAISNLEAMPGGFNHLRRMTEGWSLTCVCVCVCVCDSHKAHVHTLSFAFSPHP